MFQNIDYDNYPFIISSGNDFIFETNCIKHKILPKIKARFQNEKYFSLDFYDFVYQSTKPNNLKQVELNDFVLLNLDSIHKNGSICICLLGEKFAEESNLCSNTSGGMETYLTRLNESMKLACDSGYPWIIDANQDSNCSLLEVLSLHAGLMSGVKYPLFYFRVSGGPISENGQTPIQEDIGHQNGPMERLKQKLIRNGLPIKFYGSASEFNETVEKDLMKIFKNFPDKSNNQDDLIVDQTCFENDRVKIFTFNDNIMRIFNQLDCIFASLKAWNDTETSPLSNTRIDELLIDHYRKDFSDKLLSQYKKMSSKAQLETSACQNNRILILSGPRGSGKSSILINWLNSKQENDNIIPITHYCEASFSSSDVRIMMWHIIKKIRLICGYCMELDNYEMHSLNTELIALNQQLLAAMLLAQQRGLRLLIVIDGLDHLGDKCVSSTKQIKSVDWIPEIIPENVRIIMSSTSSDSTIRKLKMKRSDVMILEAIPESSSMQEELLKSGVIGLQTWISSLHQTSPVILIESIDDWPLIRNPLVQRILAHVYHTLGTTSNWETFIVKVSECHTVMELVRRVLKLQIHHLNWELAVSSEKMLKKKFAPKKDEDTEENATIQGWIPDCLSLLALSRHGLNLETILSSLEVLGYVKDFQVSQSDMWSLFHMTRDIILRFHDNQFKFSHSICKEIVEHTFLAIASCSSVEARTHECQDSMFIDKRCKFHILLSFSMWNNRFKDENNFLESIYHLDRASDYQSLDALLFNPRVMVKIFYFDIRTINNFQGQFKHTHQFQYFCGLLKHQGIDVFKKMKGLVNQLYEIEFEDDSDSSSHIVFSDHQEHETEARSKEPTYFQTEFAKKFAIQVSPDEERTFWTSLTDNQKCRFLLLLAQSSILMGQKMFARQIYNHIRKISRDSVLICHVLWLDIKLDSTFHKVLANYDYVKLALDNLDDLTSSLLDDNPDLATVRYLRCTCLTLKYSMDTSQLSQNFNQDKYPELMSCADNLRSVLLDSIIKELKYNTKETNENPEFLPEKIALLTDIITTLETWTGPVHRHIARLFVRLANLFKLGNCQSRFRAEACCRRALWIWKTLRVKDKYQYNSDENDCREILFKILLQDPCQASVAEAKIQIDSTFDNRMKFLGCYHPLTTGLVPNIKLVNSLDIQFTNQNITENQRVSQISARSMSFYKNQSNCKPPTVGVNNDANHLTCRTTSGSNMHRKVKDPVWSSLQFINRYATGSEYFSEDIDWDNLAGRRPSSKLSRASGSRVTSATSKRHSTMSSNLISTPIRCSTSVTNDRQSHIYLGPMSSVSSLSNRYFKDDRRCAVKQEKQVRFINFIESMKANTKQAEMASIIQRKLQNIKSIDNVPIVLKKRSLSANFARPYYVIDPIL